MCYFWTANDSLCFVAFTKTIGNGIYLLKPRLSNFCLCNECDTTVLQYIAVLFILALNFIFLCLNYVTLMILQIINQLNGSPTHILNFCTFVKVYSVFRSSKH